MLSDLELFHSFIDPLALMVLQLGRSDAMEAVVKEDAMKAVEEESDGVVRDEEVVQYPKDAANEVEVEDTELEHDVDAFMKKVKTFCREKDLEFKIPKFYGEDVDLLKLWTEVSKRGGYDTVCEKKLWKQVGRRFNPPITCTSLSFTFRQIYAKALLPYERYRLGVYETIELVDSLPCPRQSDHEAALTRVGKDMKSKTEGKRIASGMSQPPNSNRLKAFGTCGETSVSPDTRTIDSDNEHAHWQWDAALELDANNHEFEGSYGQSSMGPDVKLSWGKMRRKLSDPTRRESTKQKHHLGTVKRNCSPTSTGDRKWTSICEEKYDVNLGSPPVEKLKTSTPITSSNTRAIDSDHEHAHPSTDTALELDTNNQVLGESHYESLMRRDVNLSWKEMRRKSDPKRYEPAKQKHDLGTEESSSYPTGGRKWTTIHEQEERDMNLGPPPMEKLNVVVVDKDTPAEWVKISVYKTRDDFQIYALIPGLEPEELRIECEVSGKVVITGSPMSPRKYLWGLTNFRKVIHLPAEIETGEFRAMVSLYGQLLMRVPFLRSTH